MHLLHLRHYDSTRRAGHTIAGMEWWTKQHINHFKVLKNKKKYTKTAQLRLQTFLKLSNHTHTPLIYRKFVQNSMQNNFELDA